MSYYIDGTHYLDPETTQSHYVSTVFIIGAAAAPTTGNPALNMLLYYSAEHIKYRLEKDSNR